MKKVKHSPSLQKKIHRIWQVVVLAILSVFFLSFPVVGDQTFAKSEDRFPAIRVGEFDKFVPSLYPVDTGQFDPPEVSAQSVLVSDQESGTILYSKNPNRKLRPASITKLMTALLAVEHFSLDQVLTVKRLSPVPFESDMGLAVGDKVTVRNLVYGLLVPSGNDAAYTLADNFSGGFENFLYAMNKKAEELNMNSTHFDNPSGLDSNQHYSTASDLALLTREVLKHPFLSKVVATVAITVSDASGNKSFPLHNVNQFLGYLYGADGVKTGLTDLAGECLVASVSRDNHRVISVVLKSGDRFSDSGKLLEWVYQNFQWKQFN